MTIVDAINHTINSFPFEKYMVDNNGKEKEIYFNIAKTVNKYLKPGSEILDFGCGPCDKTAVLQLMGFNCSAYDDLQDGWHKIPGNREKIISFSNECGINFQQAGSGKLPFNKYSFDMIMMNDVIEHLHNSPRDLLNNLLELCKPNGLLFLTVPNAVNIRKRKDVLFGKTNYPYFHDYYWSPGDWRGHIREYVRDDLVALAKYLNLEILELRGCDHMLENLSYHWRPIYLLLTRIFKGWKDSWIFVARKKQDWKPNKTLSQNK